jgi:O-methyltransferase involved in polyketide biosynthesis
VGSVELNTEVPHPARIYDYLLGGKDNFEADRTASAQITSVWPNLPTSMRANRDFMRRMARYLAERRGIRQFLDIGTGLPTSPNMHEVVQDVDPTSRVVYVDNDPIVLVHARALLTSRPPGRTAYVAADLRDPQAILSAPTLAGTLDLSQPVAVCLIAIMHYIVDEQQAQSIIDQLLRPMAAGSALALSTATADTAPEEVGAGIAMYNARGITSKARTRAEVEALFRGLDLVDPGVALVSRWQPDEQSVAVPDQRVSIYGGVGIKA